MLVPAPQYVMVKPDEQEWSYGGIYLPSMAREIPNWGDVVAVGSLWVNDLSPGDRVVFTKYGTVLLEVDNVDILLLTRRDVLAKVG